MRPSQTESHHPLMGFAVSNKSRFAHGADVSFRFPVSLNIQPDTDVIIDASAAQW